MNAPGINHDNKIFRCERVPEVELKGIVKFLLKCDNAQDVAFGARTYKIEDSSENFLIPE